ncbi:MAG: hypothetical protein AAAC48_07610, partial [Phyllobacterium sp.]
LAPSPLLLRRQSGHLDRCSVFGRTKSECREQHKTHDEREEDEVLLSHRSSPPFWKQVNAHRSAFAR